MFLHNGLCPKQFSLISRHRCTTSRKYVGEIYHAEKSHRSRRQDHPDCLDFDLFIIKITHANKMNSYHKFHMSYIKRQTSLYLFLLFNSSSYD
jgi:hypothetical protein